MMNEKDKAIVEALEGLSNAVRQTLHQVQHMDTFLRNNFRNHVSLGNNAYGILDSVSLRIEEIKRLSASNKEHAHRLEKEWESQRVGIDENGNYRRSNVPPAKDIYYAEYPGDTLNDYLRGR